MAPGASDASTTGAALARVFEPWAHLYASSKVIATVVTFGHIASLLMAGGLAVTTDRATLRALRLAAGERGRHLEELAAVHRLVVTGLTLSLLTGLLLFASDVETFAGSWIFWLKMSLIAVLLMNGHLMTRAERSIRDAPADASAAWEKLRRSAVTSVGLWYAITLAGVALANIA
jgi:K+ transporter